MRSTSGSARVWLQVVTSAGESWMVYSEDSASVTGVSTNSIPACAHCCCSSWSISSVSPPPGTYRISRLSRSPSALVRIPSVPTSSQPEDSSSAIAPSRL